MNEDPELPAVPLPGHEDGAIFSKHPIPGMSCDWQEDGRGGGIWVCRPKPVTHEEVAELAYKHYNEKFPSHPMLPDALTLSFWLDAQEELDEDRHHRHHHRDTE